jgi:EAL domain-containing protein (putative c-di-GMP-specific phosphodiesterase class I)
MTTDTALEANRRTGNDRRARADAAVAAGLLAALERREIEVLFQGQYAASDNRLVGAEALARWQHPEAGRIGAAELFAAAERAHRVPELSRHVARLALTAAASWPARLSLSLNVAPEDLAASDFAEGIADLLDETGFPARRLTLEITEQSLVAELESPARRLQRLAALGVRIALDDFGAGFCNFGYLKKLPLHALKLDRSMVEGIGENARDRAVLRGIVGMAHALGLDVTAEGVETEAQRAAIVEEGCSAWQGFLGSQPLRAEAFIGMVGRQADAAESKSST